MTLPIRTTVEDIEKMCSYLSTKPTGATVSEAKAVVDSKVLDGRKITAFKFWGLIEENGPKYMLTERGRLAVKNKGAQRSDALKEIVLSVPAYKAIIERAVHRNEGALTATEVATHWHQHFRDEASNSDKILNDQAACFFQIAQGADLGQLIVGRKGHPTRFEFALDNCAQFANEDSRDNPAPRFEADHNSVEANNAETAAVTKKPLSKDGLSFTRSQEQNNRVLLHMEKIKRF